MFAFPGLVNPSNPVASADRAVMEDIDVVFLGSLNVDRRRRIVDQLRARGIKVAAPRVFGAAREQLLLRAKVVLNVHYFSSRLLQTVRLQLLLALRRFVVSEVTPDQDAMRDFAGAVVFAPFDRLVDTVVAALRQPPAARHRVADAGHAYITSRRMDDVIKPLLEEAILKFTGIDCSY